VSVGARQDTAFFIREGEARVLLFSSSGKEVSVRNLLAGDVIGDLAALDCLPRSASVLALTDVRVRILSRADFLACLDSSAETAIWMARRLGAEVRRLTEKVFELSALNVQARLHCELLRLARGDGTPRTVIIPAPTHAELASRIGTHREAVTREMRALTKMNILRNQRRSLEFIDLAALERAVLREIGTVDDLRVAS
jgi:CRP-like cAMP-binding protein